MRGASWWSRKVRGVGGRERRKCPNESSVASKRAWDKVRLEKDKSSCPNAKLSE